MKIKSILAAFVMVLAAIGVAGAGQASADQASADQLTHRQCVATGQITLTANTPNKGLYFPPPVGPTNVQASGGGTFNCLGSTPVTVSVNLTKAHCGDSEGTVTINGYTAPIITKGTLLEVGVGSNGTVSPYIVGTGNAIADPAANGGNNSCLSGTARVFQVTGTVLYH